MERPEWIMHDGWKDHVPTHDAFFLAGIKTWKKRMAAEHPDKRRVRVANPPIREMSRYDTCKCGTLKRRVAVTCDGCKQRSRHAYYFLKEQEKFENWLTEELMWYEARGIEPPAGRFQKVRTTNVRILTGGQHDNQAVPGGEGIDVESDPTTVDQTGGSDSSASGAGSAELELA